MMSLRFLKQCGVFLSLGLAMMVLNQCATPYGPPLAPAVDSTSGIPWNGPQVEAKAAVGEVQRYARSREQRPGLGTEFGDEVGSKVGYTTFERASKRPEGVSMIYYNDKEGVKVMAGQDTYQSNGLQRAANGLVEWGVKGRTGYLKNVHGQNRRFVEGKKGKSYSLVVKNICHSRLEIVLSVDGLNVMDGEEASVKKRGYIVQPGKTLVVKGFRTSLDAVAAFKFSTVEQSYTSQLHGKTRNVGVIGMAVFTEKGIDPWKWSRPAVERRMSAQAFAEAPRLRAR